MSDHLVTNGGPGRKLYRGWEILISIGGPGLGEDLVSWSAIVLKPGGPSTFLWGLRSEAHALEVARQHVDEAEEP